MYRLVISGTQPPLSLPVPAGQVEDTLSADLARAREEAFAAPRLTSQHFQHLHRQSSTAATVDTNAATAGATSSFAGNSTIEDEDYEEDDFDDYDEENDGGGPGGARREDHDDDSRKEEERAVVTALRSFVSECSASGLFTPVEMAALDELLGGGARGLGDGQGGECDAVVRAAYLVAYDGGRDAQLLWAVLKDLASKQLSKEGREEHVAQDELVEMVEYLAEGGHVSDAEALHLLGLVVRKADSVVRIYTDFAEHCDDGVVMSQLVRIAKTHTQGHPAQLAHQRTMAVQTDDVQGDGEVWEVASLDTVDSGDEIASFKGGGLPTSRASVAKALGSQVPVSSPQKAARQAALDQLVPMLHLEGLLTPGDAEVAQQLAADGNALLLAGVSRFEGDGDAVSLASLVQAVVRAERARRLAVAEAHAAHDEPSWASLPKDLLNLLQVAESQGLVAHDDAILVCNAFIHNFELVHAGWECFEADGDEAELLDTILRVLRSGRLHEQMDAFDNVRGLDGNDNESSGGDAKKDDEEADENGEDEEESSDESSEDETNVSAGWEPMQQPPRTQTAFTNFSSAEAMRGAVSLPKPAVELLRTIAGRLEAGGMLTPQEGDALLALAEAGEPVLAAAFQVYAADQDLEDLLDTLQVVARTAARHGAGVLGGRHFQAVRDGMAPLDCSGGDGGDNDDASTTDSEEGSSSGSDEGSAEEAKQAPGTGNPLSPVSPKSAPARGASNVRRADYIARGRRASGEVESSAEGSEQEPDPVELDDSDNDDEEDDEEETEAAEAPANPAQGAGGADWAKELLDLVELLGEDGQISSAEAGALMYLVRVGEPRLLAAYDAYVMFRDVDDLVDTISRVGRLFLEGRIDPVPGEDEDEGEGEDLDAAEAAAGAGGDPFSVVPYGDRALRTAERSEMGSSVKSDAAAQGTSSVTSALDALDDFDSGPDDDDDGFLEEEDGEGDGEDGDEVDGKEGDVDGDNTTLNTDNRKQMLLLMLQRGALTHDEAVALARKLLVENDALVKYAFDCFEEDSDVDNLVASLKAIAYANDGDEDDEDDDEDDESDNDDNDDDSVNSDEAATKAAMHAYARHAATEGMTSFQDSYGDDDDDDNDESAEEVEDAEGDESSADSDEVASDRDLAAVFLGVVRGMQMDEAEAAALRLCIARDDPLVRAALEVYKLERDEEDLRDTLKRIARVAVEDEAAGM